MTTKKTPTKRQVPSVERQLALALVAVLDQNVHDSSEAGTAEADARAVLKANGYEGLESIPTRVDCLEREIERAFERKDYDALPKLGQEMKRALAGKPPLNGKKKKAEPAAPKAARASRKSSKPIGGPDPAIVPVKCGYTGVCQWEGEAVVGSPCPDCETPVVAVEKENTDA